MLPGVWDESYARLAAQGEANKTAALQQGSGGQIAVVRSYVRGGCGANSCCRKNSKKAMGKGNGREGAPEEATGRREGTRSWKEKEE